MTVNEVIVGLMLVFCAGVMTQLIWWFLCAIFGSKKPDKSGELQAKFAAARALLEAVRVDPETGEHYTYKITRVAIDPVLTPQREVRRA